MKSKPDVFKESDVQHVIDRIKKLSERYQNYDTFLVELIKSLDTNNNGVIEFDELVDRGKSLGLNFSY